MDSLVRNSTIMLIIGGTLIRKFGHVRKLFGSSGMFVKKSYHNSDSLT